MKIVVGLGNPGSKYRETRHNVGFQVLDQLRSRFPVGSSRSVGQAETYAIELTKEKLLLVWPQTFMNLSGRAVQPIAGFYKVDVARDLLVVCDDLSLPLGKLRIRPQGSAGGQKGLADILASLGTQAVPRLRIGIDPPPDNWDAADWVLGKFDKEQKISIDIACNRATDAVLDWVEDGLVHCMNNYNK